MGGMAKGPGFCQCTGICGSSKHHAERPTAIACLLVLQLMQRLSWSVDHVTVQGIMLAISDI